MNSMTPAKKNKKQTCNNRLFLLVLHLQSVRKLASANSDFV